MWGPQGKKWGESGWKLVPCPPEPLVRAPSPILRPQRGARVNKGMSFTNLIQQAGATGWGEGRLPFVPVEFRCWVGRDSSPHHHPPPSRGHGQHTWGTGTPYPGLVKSEVPVSAGFLLLPLCLESGVSTFLSSPGGEELSLCKTEGQRGEPLNCCDIGNRCLDVQRGSASR